ncbi:MAG: type II toxin-antitoxin system Phd/YefM family antitoxin [Chloroflexota bacterium]
MQTPRQADNITMADARRELTRLPERLEAHPATVAVTRRGKPVLAIMTWEDYEAILETLEVLSDEEAVRQLRQSAQEIKDGQTVSWEDARAGL